MIVLMKFNSVNTDDTIVHTKCDEASHLWQQLQGTSENESE